MFAHDKHYSTKNGTANTAEINDLAPGHYHVTLVTSSFMCGNHNEQFLLF